MLLAIANVKTLIALSDNAIYIVTSHLTLIAYPILSRYMLLLLHLQKASKIKAFKDFKNTKFGKTS